MWKHWKEGVTSVVSQSLWTAGRMRCGGPLVAACVLAALGAGCGSGSKAVLVNPSNGLAAMPPAPAAAAANTYTGTESLGVWSLQLDDSAGSYSYSDSTGAVAAASGSFTHTGGFLSLGQANGASLGYILEVPGRLALLRPGDTTAPLVVSVPQTTCYTLPAFLRFQYIAMESAPNIEEAVASAGKDYGSILASSSGTAGGTWQYEALTGTTAAGPGSIAGTCAVANNEATLSISGSTFFNTAGATVQQTVTGVETSLAIGPSGIFVAQQVGSTAETGTTYAAVTGVAGVAEPQSPLSVSAIVTGTYLGFITEAAEGNQLAASTSPASFAPVSGSTTTLGGGLYPSDDVTQTPGSDTTIVLGSQSATLNGFYPSVMITRPDPNQLCYSDHPSGVGTEANGYPICTFPAVAVVGNPEGKYVLFINSFDYTAGTLASPGTAMQIYLYQQ